MDTRSSSGSGSRSTSNPTSQGEGQPLQQPTYTTAGTLYNPQSAAPRQPPARRGRASRWPLVVPSDLSAFNPSLLGGKLSRRHRSPTTTASTLRHYSPLQQNHERAVDPSHHHQHQKRSISISPVNMSLSTSFPELPRPLVGDNSRIDDTFPGLPRSLVACIKQNGDASLNDENKDQGDGDDELERLLNLPVKTLTSLASYSNPHQKAAQKILDRARVTTKTAAEASRASTPNPFRQGLDGASAQSSSYGLGRESSEYFSRVPRNTHINSSARSSVLSNGPGAPQPLTAGPPGQRQYKASTLDGPLRALNANAQKPPSSTFNESHLSNNPVALPNMDFRPSFMTADPPNPTEQQARGLRKIGGPQAFQTSVRNSNTTGGEYPWERNPSFPPTLWVSEPTETRTPEQIQEYYPGGGPSNYNPNNIISVADHDTSLPLMMGAIDRRSYPNLEARRQSDARHRAAFYWKKETHLKVFDEVTQEFDQKLLNRQLGVSDSTKLSAARQVEFDPTFGSSDVGKVLNISVTFVDQMQTHEVAKPLLNMAFTTLSNYWDSGRLLGVPTGFDKVNKAKEGHDAVNGENLGRTQYLGKWGLPRTPPGQ